MTQKTNSHLKKELKDVRKASQDMAEKHKPEFLNLKWDDRS